MNTYEVTLGLRTYSEDPEEWIIDSIAQVLEDDERLDFIEVKRTEQN